VGRESSGDGAAPNPSPQPVARCSKPITPGTAAQLGGRPVHVRCFARETQLEAIEQQDRASLERPRGHAAMGRADELMDMVRVYQTTCAVCGEGLGTNRGVLFQGDQLVHAGCWRADPKTFDARVPHRAPSPSPLGTGDSERLPCPPEPPLTGEPGSPAL
jgi:hypothetical protein